jgi:hypothetical protein
MAFRHRAICHVYPNGKRIAWRNHGENEMKKSNKANSARKASNGKARKAAPKKAAQKNAAPQKSFKERIAELSKEHGKGFYGASSGYRGHREGSNKEAIHKLFDSCKDREKLLAAGEKLKLQPSTMATWLAAWGGMKAAGQGAFKKCIAA